MALVHDDEVKEVGRIFAVQTRAVLVLGEGLIDGEVDFQPLADLAVGDLPTGIAERCEGFVLRVVDEDVAVGQVENLGPAVFAGVVSSPHSRASSRFGKRPASCRCQSPL
jgi:hypothetical protein